MSSFAGIELARSHSIPAILDVSAGFQMTAFIATIRPASATLTFTVPTTGSLVADADGNLVPPTTTKVIRAMLRPSRVTDLTEGPGVDPSRTYVEGQIVEVVGQTGAAKFKAPSDCTVDTPATITADWLVGTYQFKLEEFAPKIYAAVMAPQIPVGDNIKGYVVK